MCEEGRGIAGAVGPFDSPTEAWQVPGTLLYVSVLFPMGFANQREQVSFWLRLDQLASWSPSSLSAKPICREFNLLLVSTPKGTFGLSLRSTNNPAFLEGEDWGIGVLGQFEYGTRRIEMNRSGRFSLGIGRGRAYRTSHHTDKMLVKPNFSSIRFCSFGTSPARQK